MQRWVTQGKKEGAAKKGKRLSLGLVLNWFLSAAAGEMLPMGPCSRKGRQQQEACRLSSLAAGSAVSTAPAAYFVTIHFG